MQKTLIKPRWENWENICIQKAFEEKIQHKIIAMALGKSVTAVSKKITALGLRGQISLSGRLNKDKNRVTGKEKIPLDVTRMSNILQAYAPLRVSQKGQMTLKGGSWTSAKPLSLKENKKKTQKSHLQQEKVSFSLSIPLDYILSKNPPLAKKQRRKIFGDPVYVSLCHMEEWAVSEGFHQIKEIFPLYGLVYWKDGKYFSKAQLLMYVNRMRFDRHLQPLALFEEENSLEDKNTYHQANQELKKA